MRGAGFINKLPKAMSQNVSCIDLFLTLLTRGFLVMMADMHVFVFDEHDILIFVVWLATKMSLKLLYFKIVVVESWWSSGE